MGQLPLTLQLLQTEEAISSVKGLEIIKNNKQILLHIEVIEDAMHICHSLLSYSAKDKDSEVIMMLGIRLFNAFGAGLRLALSGYFQNSALIIRDIIETGFLIDLFRGDRALIEKWRCLDKQSRMRVFGPVRIRKILDERDGATKGVRSNTYEMFSEMAGHPTMASQILIRSDKDKIFQVGPFIDVSLFRDTVAEMARVALHISIYMEEFFPPDCLKAKKLFAVSAEKRERWIKEFPKAHLFSS